METRKYYSNEELNKLCNYLEQQKSLETPIEYEIRIDNMVAVRRTDDPDRFFDYVDLVQSTSRELIILLYKGASRVSDKYVFLLSDAPATTPIQTFEERLDAAMEEDRKERLRQYELDKLKGIVEQQRKKIKKQKRKVKQLRQAVTAAGSESAGLAKVLKDLAGSPSVKGLFGTKAGNESAVTASLDGLPDEAVMSYLKDYRQKLGEQTFQELLGTTLTMAQQPELIAQVRAFITDKTSKL